jgi:integrator complex subunit 4
LQDEADVFSAFSHLGRNHKKFVGYIVKETFEEVRLCRVYNITKYNMLIVLHANETNIARVFIKSGTLALINF